MNKIVRKHFDARLLPDDIQVELGRPAFVELTVVADTPSERIPTLEDIFAARKPPFRTGADVVQSQRRSRDAWDR